MAISEGTTPPLSLLQADGTRFEMSSILGRARILLAFGPTLGWLRSVASREAELADYELQVLAVMPQAQPQVLDDAPPSSAWLRIGPADSAALESYGVRDGAAMAFLVGKDAGIKKVHEGEADLDEVLALIDTRPMRQADAPGRCARPKCVGVAADSAFYWAFCSAWKRALAGTTCLSICGPCQPNWHTAPLPFS